LADWADFAARREQQEAKDIYHIHALRVRTRS